MHYCCYAIVPMTRPRTQGAAGSRATKALEAAREAHETYTNWEDRLQHLLDSTAPNPQVGSAARVAVGRCDRDVNTGVGESWVSSEGECSCWWNNDECSRWRACVMCVLGRGDEIRMTVI